MKNKIENIQSDITLENKNENDNHNDDEIDLGAIYNFIFRNKFLISTITFLFFLFFSLFALNKKKVWEGNFEIVLDQSKNEVASSMFGGNRIAEAFKSQVVGISSNGIQTEMGILESPSVLMPTFNYLKKLKKEIEPNNELFFSNWKNNYFKIDLKDNTSIVKISYRDNNKDLIIPVLNKISKTYQIYSGKTKKRNLEILQSYLYDQIEKYKNKSYISLEEAQDYGREQDLTILDVSNSSLDVSNSSNKDENASINNPIANINIESVRVSAANEIRKINFQIKKIQEMDDSDKLQNLVYMSENINTEKIKNIDQELIELKSKYKETDPVILSLLEIRKLLIKELKRTQISILKSRRLEAESRRDAAERPKGVLVKYKELIRKAARNEDILVELENQLTQINLEKARIEDPWQLITEPTLKRRPIGPKKIPIALMGVVVGFFIGLGASFYIEKKSDYIFEKKFLIEFLNTNIIDIFNLDNLKFLNFSIDIFFNEFINVNSKGDLRFICTKNISAEMQLIFRKVLEEFKEQNLDSFKNRKLIFEDNLALVKDNDKLILLTSLDSLTYTEIKNLQNRLKNLNRNVNGFLLFEK